MDSLKSGVSAARHCPARRRCPVGCICGVEHGDGSPALLPYFSEADPGDLLFSDFRFEQRVHFVQSGIFTVVASSEHERNAAFALYCSGHCIGLAELYMPHQTSGHYYVQALTEGRVCSFPTKALRRHLEALPSPKPMQILTCAFTNISNQAYAQSVVLTRPRVQDRIVTLALFMREMMAREGLPYDEIHLSQDVLAGLVASDRLTTGRALRRLEDEGLVELGYRSVRLTPALVRLEAPDGAHVVFLNPEDLG